MNEAKIEYGSKLGPDLWALILSHLEPVSYRSWCIFRLVSRLWCSVISLRKSQLAITGHSEFETLVSRDFVQFGRYLTSLSIVLPSSLLDLLANDSFFGQVTDSFAGPEKFIDQCLEGLAKMGRLRELTLSHPNWFLPLPRLVEVAAHWPNLRILRLSYRTIGFNWQILNNLFAAIPNLDFLAFTGTVSHPLPDLSTTFELLEPSSQFLWPLAALRDAEVQGIGPPLALAIPTALRYLPLVNLVNLTIREVYGEYDGLIDVISRLDHLKRLILVNTNVWRTPSGALGPVTLFPCLETLEWYSNTKQVMRQMERVLHLNFVLRLPKLQNLTSCIAQIASPPVPGDGEAPPPVNETLTYWHLLAPSPNSAFNWAVFQLVPRLATLILDQPSFFPRFINDLPRLNALEIRQCDLNAEAYKTLLLRTTFWNSLRRLTFRNCRVPSAPLMQILHYGKNITELTITKDHKLTSDAISFFTKLPLTRLTLTGCSNLGSSILTHIANMTQLEHLGLSHIPDIWTQHLRRLENLSLLRSLHHVQFSRNPSNANFNTLQGLWPKLETFKVEDTANKQSLTETFRPFVNIIFKRAPTLMTGESRQPIP